MRLKGFIALASALAWAVSVLLHERFLPTLSYAPGIDYVFFPSGIRFIAILVGGVWAAIGVSIGSVVLWGAEFGLTTWAPVLLLSLCSGFAPYFALRATLAVLGVTDDLGNLRPAHLPLISFGGAARFIPAAQSGILRPGIAALAKLLEFTSSPWRWATSPASSWRW